MITRVLKYFELENSSGINLLTVSRLGQKFSEERWKYIKLSQVLKIMETKPCDIPKRLAKSHSSSPSLKRISVRKYSLRGLRALDGPLFSPSGKVRFLPMYWRL